MLPRSRLAMHKNRLLLRVPAYSDPPSDAPPPPPPPPAEWDPASIGTVHLDIDSRHVTLDSEPTRIVSAQDQSGNGFHATAPGTLPYYEASNPDYGGKPAIRFYDGIANDALLVTGGASGDMGVQTLGNNFTLIVVGHIDGPKIVPFLTTGSGEAGLVTYGGGGFGNGEEWDMSSGGAVYHSGLSTLTPGITVCTFEGPTSRIYQNSKTAVPMVVAGHTVTPGSGWGIGNAAFTTPGTTFVWSGPYLRFLVYRTALSNAGIGAALDGLAAIYGTTIAP